MRPAITLVHVPYTHIHEVNLRYQSTCRWCKQLGRCVAASVADGEGVRPALFLVHVLPTHLHWVDPLVERLVDGVYEINRRVFGVAAGLP